MKQTHQAVRCNYMLSVNSSESKCNILQCQLFKSKDFCILFEVWPLRQEKVVPHISMNRSECGNI